MDIPVLCTIKSQGKYLAMLLVQEIGYYFLPGRKSCDQFMDAFAEAFSRSVGHVLRHSDTQGRAMEMSPAGWVEHQEPGRSLRFERGKQMKRWAKSNPDRIKRLTWKDGKLDRCRCLGSGITLE